jgi:IS5 family transposase
MKQQTLTGFEKHGKTTRRAQFLSDMDRVVPWPQLMAVVEPFYPNGSKARRSTADTAAADAAGVLPAAVVQPVGSRR